jgi:hypothetical protein
LESALTRHWLYHCQEDYPESKVDQVIDLVFNNGDFYRDTGTHTCEGDVGSPSGQLVLDIMYRNGTEFQDIPTNNIGQRNVDNKSSKGDNSVE